ncbi:MAG TPA: low affinity iron permease family protein, partial [Thermomicrobiales bacterium]|nr:low affinity iron permease family protein [Thermomicrobiales bacterium]
MTARFSRWSNMIATVSGYWQTFIIMTGICLVWALSGPLFGFSDTWQLVINTATTVLTFLMVFLIQNTQNRDALAVHLKLDELIHSIGAADNNVMSAEEDDEEQMAELKKRYIEISNQLGIEPAVDLRENSKTAPSSPAKRSAKSPAGASKPESRASTT